MSGRLSVRVSPEIIARLDALATRTMRSKASIARQAIAEYLEDVEDTDTALTAIEAHLAASARTTPNDKLLALFGSME